MSTPLLLIPFGIVPSKDVSLLLYKVTGKPVLNLVIPETDQPRIHSPLRPGRFPNGSFHS